ncbi:ATP-binding cassette domain-containing protein [Candidatus Acetothermia bacterium]|nr:ATP-binding cassette domain-containing protein [Candidatus Acetothermia bacterium]MBI3757654.1 ATP-binding cassette domain-containing protein [Deltaproteobacteria bacterium]
MIKLVNLTKSIENKRVLQGVNLEIEREQITLILGQSGVGKTVLLRLLLGLIKPDGGEIWIEGENIVPLNERELDSVRKRCGVLFQGGALFDSLTVGENIAFPLRQHTHLSERELHGKVHEKLEQVGLDGIERQKPAELSGGMRKRVALARALALDPEILLLDEPTAGLDPVTGRAIADLIHETQMRSKATCVAVTHDLTLVERLADRVALLHDGKILAVGTPHEMLSSSDSLVKEFLKGVEL